MCGNRHKNEVPLTTTGTLGLIQIGHYLQQVQWRIEPKRMASNTLLFPRKIFMYVTCRVLELALEITYFNSQTRLTPGKRIVRFCLKYLSRNCRYFASDETTATLIHTPAML
jgi:hypothetical protein